MKSLKVIIAVYLFFFLIGCQQTTQNSSEQTDILNPNHRQETPNAERNAQLGYVRYTQEEFHVEGGSNEISIDRGQAADMITRIMLQTDNFKEVATLVTDQEVVIAYEMSQEMEETEAENIAEKTALSILPDFYTVYTSDNAYHMDVIHSLHLEATDQPDSHEVIDKIIRTIEEENHEPNRR